jgi:hypothetical protein
MVARAGTNNRQPDFPLQVPLACTSRFPHINSSRVYVCVARYGIEHSRIVPPCQSNAWPLQMVSVGKGRINRRMNRVRSRLQHGALHTCRMWIAYVVAIFDCWDVVVLAGWGPISDVERPDCGAGG